jgi:hypothetical protein
MAVTRRQAAHGEKTEESAISDRSATHTIAKGNAKAFKPAATTERWVYALLVIFAITTVATCPRPFHPQGKPTVNHVFFYGWLTAISTGLGVFPFVFLPNVSSYWVGISNGEYRIERYNADTVK